jgi:diguanylate cyclase (GGDEF)-like protein
MLPGPSSKPPEAPVARARTADFANQLRAAAADGDDARITRVLAELLRCKGLSRGQRIALQQKALLGLVQSLRSAALNDDLTGLHNRRGFMQIGTRMLDVAAGDDQPVHLVYFCADQLVRINESLGRPAGQMLIRQAGNLLRDLFPAYGVHEVLGRMGSDEFAALTSNADFASREGAVCQIEDIQRASSPPLTLSVGVAHFDPRSPAGIDELLEEAKRNMNQPASDSGVGLSLPISQLGLSALSAYRV